MSGSSNATSEAAHRADPGLVAAWLRARSIARSLPAPVADRGGWRVDTRSEAEECRYLFADISAELRELTLEIDRPGIFLKICASDADTRRILPARWHLDPQSHVMTGPRDVANHAVPQGYLAKLSEIAGAIHARIETLGGVLAASGYAAEADGVFVYDRIVTVPEHQRRGLGGALMALLGSQRRSRNSRQMLVATDQGRALYTTLGWHYHAPYATAIIPDPDV